MCMTAMTGFELVKMGFIWEFYLCGSMSSVADSPVDHDKLKSIGHSSQLPLFVQ